MTDPITEQPICTCGHTERQHAARKWECYECVKPKQCPDYTPAPSQARDDAEKLTDEEVERLGMFADQFTLDGPVHRNLVKQVEWMIAAHMAAPDELTALRAEIQRLRDGIEEIAKDFDGLMSFEGGGTEDRLRELLEDA